MNEAKTFQAMSAMKNQAVRLAGLVSAAKTPEELREALRDMCGCALRLETGAHFLAGDSPDVETATKYIDGVTASIDVREREKEKRDATAYSLSIGGSAFDRLYADFEGIGAIVTWVRNSNAYRVRIHKATQAAFDAMVNKWKAIGATLITH